MSTCKYTGICAFFTDAVGYSPDLWEEMKAIYCHGDWKTCARLEAAGFLALEDIPDELLPSDFGRVKELARSAEAAHTPPTTLETERL